MDVVAEEPTKKPDNMTEQVFKIINYEKAELKENALEQFTEKEIKMKEKFTLSLL